MRWNKMPATGNRNSRTIHVPFFFKMKNNKKNNNNQFTRCPSIFV